MESLESVECEDVTDINRGELVWGISTAQGLAGSTRSQIVGSQTLNSLKVKRMGDPE